MDINVIKQLIQATGLLARVIQHEYDHLNGVLFVDKLEEKVRNKALVKFEKVMSKERKVHA